MGGGVTEIMHLNPIYPEACGESGLTTSNHKDVDCPLCRAKFPRDLETEVRAFIAFLGIENASWQDRVDKLVEELRERREAVLGPSTLDEKIKEFADVALVNLINYLKARDELEGLGVRAESAMLAKIDEVKRR
jgi:hypothetical protein